MDSGLSNNLATLKEEFSPSPVETVVDLPPDIGEPAEPVDISTSNQEIVEFPTPSTPIAEPLHTPPTEPLPAETLPGILEAETAYNVKTLKLSEFISWLSEDGDSLNNAIKTLSAEMSLAGFSAPTTHDLTLAAAMWGKKNYRGQNAAETINYILSESTPVRLKAEIDTFTPFNSEQTLTLLAESDNTNLNSYLVLTALSAIAALSAYTIAQR